MVTISFTPEEVAERAAGVAGEWRRHSDGYPYPHPRRGYTQHPNGQPQPPVLPPAPKGHRKMAVGCRRGHVAAHRHRIHVEAVPLKHKGYVGTTIMEVALSPVGTTVGRVTLGVLIVTAIGVAAIVIRSPLTTPVRTPADVATPTFASAAPAANGASPTTSDATPTTSHAALTQTDLPGAAPTASHAATPTTGGAGGAHLHAFCTTPGVIIRDSRMPLICATSLDGRLRWWPEHS
jgi:hypothetical protein